MDFDLSEVMFITTSNIESDIPYVLRDRLEIIRLSGYTEHEKTVIAKKHLIPRAIESNGLKNSWINFEVAALKNTWFSRSGRGNAVRAFFTKPPKDRASVYGWRNNPA